MDDPEEVDVFEGIPSLDDDFGAERQVVGICLRYPGAAETLTLRGDDFGDRLLGRLFEACRLIPERPATPGPWLRVDPSEWATTPVPDEWAAWLVEVEDWRPRQAARLVMINPELAVRLYDNCGLLGSLPRWAKEVEDATALRKYRLTCSYALSLIDQGAAADEVRAVLMGVA